MKMEQSENKTKKKQKTAIIFASKRSEAKWKRKTAILFASKQNEAKRKRKTAIIFASKRNGSQIFFASMWKNEISKNKMKKKQKLQSEKG
jgi:putative SOS response-associated peptidase YedK